SPPSRWRAAPRSPHRSTSPPRRGRPAASRSSPATRAARSTAGRASSRAAPQPRRRTRQRSPRRFAASELLGLALRGDRVHRRGHGLGIAKVEAAPGAQALIELVDERDPRWYVLADDRLVRQAVEVLDQRPQAVAVGRYQHALAPRHAWRDALVPIRH